MTRAGTVTVAGRPNAGKSTLLNRLVGQRLAITSPKPQSTRERVVGLVSDQDSQIILLDTPGLLEPAYELQRSMRQASLRALHDADVIIHLVDAIEGTLETLAAAAGLDADRAPRAPTILAFNKSDALSETRRAALAHRESRRGRHVRPDRRRRAGPARPRPRPAAGAPFYYDPEELSTQNMRFFAAEMIRETALEQLEDEVPYSVACEIEEFREARSPVYIRAVLHVERESQKRILIGAGGARIKSIGTRARAKIEALLGGPVYLDLHVKVLANWRRDSAALRRLGYRVD